MEEAWAGPLADPPRMGQRRAGTLGMASGTQPPDTRPLRASATRTLPAPMTPFGGQLDSQRVLFPPKFPQVVPPSHRGLVFLTTVHSPSTPMSSTGPEAPDPATLPRQLPPEQRWVGSAGAGSLQPGEPAGQWPGSAGPASSEGPHGGMACPQGLGRGCLSPCKMLQNACKNDARALPACYYTTRVITHMPRDNTW